MSLFFETIRVKNTKIQNLAYHNARLNATIKAHFHNNANIDLQEHIVQADIAQERCKVTYHDSIKTIQFFPYIPRKVHSLQLIASDITYNFKNVDREEIDTLFNQREECDDILIIKEGFVTDTSIANFAYHDGVRWITPKSPLLLGTMRASLIKKQLLLEKDVKIEDIKKASRFALMNALIGFQEIKGLKLQF